MLLMGYAWSLKSFAGFVQIDFFKVSAVSSGFLQLCLEGLKAGGKLLWSLQILYLCKTISGVRKR